ncbi:histidine phosphatase family protein [Acidovorax sp. NCPPB 2350]|nr:histidine phosphatase family protein [Acidovorax sp. NCPPB 2350]
MTETRPPPARLWLARHAAPRVAPDLCYGALDVPADAQATAEAARRLAAALPAAVAAIWHSPLQRCEQLARLLHRHRPDWSPAPDPRLAEMDFGRWEGRAWNAIARAEIDAWTADFAGHAPGGGESLARMMARVDAALADARRAASAARAREGAADVVWITHAGVARCVRWRLEHPGRLPSAGEWPSQAPGCGEWHCVELPTDAPPG